MAEKRKPASSTGAAKKVSQRREPKKTPVSPLERWRMIAEAAYYRAEKRGLVGTNPIQDWLDAEKEIDSRYTVDYGKVMTALNPSEMMEQFHKAIGRYRLPAMDLEGVMDTQRKNVEALTVANQKAFESMRSIISRQMEILRETMESTAGAIKDLSAVASPKDVTKRQSELLRQAVERALSNMREMTEMVSQANTEAFTSINARATENLKEIRALTQRLTKSH